MCGTIREHQIMPTTRKPNTLNAVMAKFANFLKATPQDQLDDVADALDNADVSSGDLWNRNGTAMSASEHPTGPQEAMDGASGASRMVGHYSTATANDSTPTADLAKRLESIEGVLKALLGHVFKADVSDEDRFPDDEGDKDGKDEDDTDDVAKGIAKLSLADAFSYLTNRTTAAAEKAARAQEARDNIASPPSMTHGPLSKAQGRSLRQVVGDAISTGIRPNGTALSGTDEIGLRRLHAALGHVEAGHDAAHTMVARLRSELAI
jgi:hypothetical protein